MLLGFLPVILYLVILIFFDSYKLVRLRTILLALVAGAVAAGVCYFANTALMEWLEMDTAVYSPTLAPFVEEPAKVIFLLVLIRCRRIGFMLDAAILGFAVGTGFAVTENMFFWFNKEMLLDAWLIRGAGTAVMHGGTVALFGIVTKLLAERWNTVRLVVFLPGLLVAIAVHLFFNNFFLSVRLTTLAILLILPPILVGAYFFSERALERWLGRGFDMDMELMRLLKSGHFSQSPVGRYLESLRAGLPGRVVADMLCYLRLYTELSIRAKGILLLRKTGLPVERDPEIAEKFAELLFLEKSIGRLGKLALQPFLHRSDRDLWQLHMIQR
jgi:RsiW-degrading membrane proteinase PrsW (M82 family)